MRKVPDAAWLALAFLASRAVLLACGLHFNFDLDWFVLPDPVYLRDDLLRTLWNFHSFPPGWAALTGVLLKLSPEHTAVLAHAVFIGLGLLLTLSLFSLARLIGLSRGGAMALALGFSLTPPALYFENLYHYEFIVTALLTWSAVLFHRALRARSARAWAGFFAVCAALGFFRSMMPLSWFLVVAGLAVLLARRARKQVLLGALLPLVALLGLSLKNLVVFGVFGAHTQDGNLLMATADQLPDDVHRAWEAEGKLSHFGKRPFAGPRTFLPSFSDEPQWAHPTLTDLERPSFGSPNFNHWVFLRVNVERRRDVLAYLREYPGAFVERAWNRGLRASLSPSTRWHPRTGTAASPHFEHRQVLGAWEDLWNRFVHESFFAPVGLYALLPVGLLWAVWRARRLLAADDDAQRALGGWWCFVLAQVLWVGALMSAATVGEHARYRFVIEAFLWLVMAGAVSDLVSRLRWRRAQA